MHAVLSVQEEGRHPRAQKSLEEGKAQAALGGGVGDDRWTKLFVVADEGELPTTVREGHQARRLRRLRRLINQHGRERVPSDRLGPRAHTGAQ